MIVTKISLKTRAFLRKVKQRNKYKTFTKREANIVMTNISIIQRMQTR